MVTRPDMRGLACFVALILALAWPTRGAGEVCNMSTLFQYEAATTNFQLFVLTTIISGQPGRQRF
ncbi:exported hypothetical protein [Verrucomicrobia bacterium]|nr:exported hypothetical protein [Verrucomicrobiota bacterium]